MAGDRYVAPIESSFTERGGVKQKGADVSKRANGRTALKIARTKGRKEIAEILRAHDHERLVSCPVSQLTFIIDRG